jgi:hypothetical protein
MWLTSETTTDASTTLCQIRMIQKKCKELIIDVFRTCLGHTEAVVVDFAVNLSAKLRFFIRTWLTSSGPK